MKIGCSVNFRKESLHIPDYLEFFHTFVHFSPERLSTDDGKERTLAGEPIESLIPGVWHQYFILSGKDGSILSGIEDGYRFIDTAFDSTDGDMEAFISKPGFISAYLYDSNYTGAQNTKIGKYIMDESSLKDTPFFISSEGYKVYDITHNPGREEHISFTSLLPAWKMWFGEGFFQYIPKEKLLGFSQAYQVRELSNGIVYIQLFENIADSASELGRVLQWAWRNWLDFDELVKKY